MLKQEDLPAKTSRYWPMEDSAQGIRDTKSVRVANALRAFPDAIFLFLLFASLESLGLKIPNYNHIASNNCKSPKLFFCAKNIFSLLRLLRALQELH
jgi:hypothetical protein